VSLNVRATRSRKDVSTLSDEELVLNCKYELPYETRSFRVLIERYQERVLAKAESMLGNLEDARDQTQEIFLRVYNNLPKFGMKSSFSTWVYIITVNTCLNLIDKRKRSPHWWLTEELDDDFAQKEESEIFLLMGKGVEKSDVSECIEETFKEIGDANREILELRFLEELDYQTVADKMKIGLSAMKMRLKRAREAFRAEFEMRCMGERDAD